MAVAGVALLGPALLAGCTSQTTTGQSDTSTSASAEASDTASAEASHAESDSASPTQSAASESASATTAPTAAPTGKGKEVYKGVTVYGGKGETPTVVLSEDFKPVSVLHTKDIYQGTGDPVVDGSVVTVNYVGVGQQSGAEFDSSFARGEPATFPLSGVIEGWSEGLIGMQAGGRRVLIIPGDMAYGSVGNPPAIGPDETLVFVVDMLETTSATPSAG